MDKSAPYTIAQGTIITSALSAFITGIYGITKGHPNYGLLAGTAALNSGVTAATFFGLRECVITPFLVSYMPWPQYTRQRRELKIDEPPSLFDRRMHKLLDSGLGGAATGGALRGWKSGPAAVLPGALTVAVACTALQYAFNEAGIARLEYISRHTSRDNVPAIITMQPLEHSAPVISSPSFVEKVVHLLGIRNMSDEEYLDNLKKNRNLHLRRIRELETQIANEHKGDNDNRP